MLWRRLREFFMGAGDAVATFRPEWREMLEQNLPLYGRLPESLRERLHERIARFVESTRFEACNGLELSEEMILTVAAQACLLVLQRDGEPYPKLRNVYLYPTTFRSLVTQQNAMGVVSEEEISRVGESWPTDTVILAWDRVEHDAYNLHDGHNVTLHEFSHQLDHEDGPTDGAPVLSNRAGYRYWAEVFSENYEDFTQLIERGKPTVLDSYGATNPAEFFAVATETFFEKPKQLAKRRPELFEILQQFYGVDPRAWK